MTAEMSTTLTDDLMTIIDFCDAMARWSSPTQSWAPAAHALAHRLTDEPGREVDWDALLWWANYDDSHAYSLHARDGCQDGHDARRLHVV